MIKLRDGRTRLAYRAEHAIELDSGLLLATTIRKGDLANGESLVESLIALHTNLICSGADQEIQQVPADKGHHPTATLAWRRGVGIRTYIPERESKTRRKWAKKPAEWQTPWLREASSRTWRPGQAAAWVAE